MNRIETHLANRLKNKAYMETIVFTDLDAHNKKNPTLMKVEVYKKTDSDNPDQYAILVRLILEIDNGGFSTGYEVGGAPLRTILSDEPSRRTETVYLDHFDAWIRDRNEKDLDVTSQPLYKVYLEYVEWQKKLGGTA